MQISLIALPFYPCFFSFSHLDVDCVIKLMNFIAFFKKKCNFICLICKYETHPTIKELYTKHGM